MVATGVWVTTIFLILNLTERNGMRQKYQKSNNLII